MFSSLQLQRLQSRLSGTPALLLCVFLFGIFILHLIFSIGKGLSVGLEHFAVFQEAFGGMYSAVCQLLCDKYLAALRTSKSLQCEAASQICKAHTGRFQPAVAFAAFEGAGVIARSTTFHLLF